MATGAGVGVQFFNRGNALYNINSTTISGSNGYNLLNPIAVPANSIENFSFIPQQNMQLWATVAAATTSIAIIDQFGNLVNAAASPLVNTLIYSMTAFTEYVIQIVNTVIIPINTNAVSLSAKVNPTVGQYFNGGFSNQIQPTTGLSVSTDSFGSVTYTFTAYSLTAGSNFLLLNATNSLGVTSVTVTSSDLTVQANKNFPVVIGESIQVYAQPLKTTLFTGTIVVSVLNAGTPQFANIVGYSV